jgi:hypothetical protein
MSVKSKIATLRELIWPLLEPLEEIEEPNLTIDDINVDCHNLRLALELTKEQFVREETRRQTVESKALFTANSLGIASTIILWLAKDLPTFFATYPRLIWIVLAISTFLTILYLLRAVWFAVKTLERANYDYPSQIDILSNESEIEYIRRLILILIIKKTKNQVVTNLKVDNMVMSYEYFKRAIISLLVLAGAIALGSLIRGVQYPENAPSFEVGIFVYVVSGLLLVCIVLQIVVYLSIRQTE